MLRQCTAYCLDWHLSNSDAFKDILIDPLRDYADIQLAAWDGENLPGELTKDSPTIFCMLPPAPDLIKGKENVVWIPMWDQAQGYDDKWWNSLPRNIKVVAFSDAIYRKALAAGLKVLRLKYYKNPANFKEANWQNGRIIYYWNRVGMVGPEFLEKLCHSLNATELLFKPINDPRIETNKFYELPVSLGNTKITLLDKCDTREEYLKRIESANVVLSPRLTEGVGMVYLESLARGCAVIAHNAPTMNEYIDNGKTGVLIEKRNYKKRFLRNDINDNYEGPYLVSPNQPWDKIATYDYQSMGKASLSKHEKGFKIWQQSAEEYCDFIFG